MTYKRGFQNIQTTKVVRDKIFVFNSHAETSQEANGSKSIKERGREEKRKRKKLREIT